MATQTTLLRPYKAKDGTQQIVIRVEHEGKQRVIPVGRKVHEKNWSGARVIKHPDQVIINSVIASKEAEINRYLADCQLHGKPIRLDLIGTGKDSYSFTEYLDHRAAQYEASEKPVMHSKVMRFALEIRAAFGAEVYFEDVTLDWLRRLEQYYISIGNIDNTRHKKFKFLREFFGQAIKEGKASSPNPFEDYKIVPKPVKKEKLTEAQIKAIESLQLAPGPVNDARNIFLFSYYAKGQRFEVCATLRRDQINDGRIYFKTNKGNAFLSVKIHERLQAILGTYPTGEFIFPYIKSIPEKKKAYLSMVGTANTMVNRNLKVVGGLAGIPFPLTVHLARHSFAYQLKKVSDNIHVIKEALGHSDYRITETYLKALEDERIDEDMEKLYGK
jgi:integrase